MSEPGEDVRDTLISESFEFTAPAEVVFDVLTNPDRTSRWLPLGMNTESAGGGEVRIKVGSGTHGYGVQVEPERLALRWRSLDVAGLHGAAQVRDAPAGGSVVHAEITVPETAAGDERARDLLAETMRRLQRDVSDNFNAG